MKNVKELIKIKKEFDNTVYHILDSIIDNNTIKVILGKGTILKNVSNEFNRLVEVCRIHNVNENITEYYTVVLKRDDDNELCLDLLSLPTGAIIEVVKAIIDFY